MVYYETYILITDLFATLAYGRWHSYHILTYLVRALLVHVAYLFTKCVTKSCDSPLVINLHHHVLLKQVFDLTMCKMFSKFYLVKKILSYC